MAIEKKHQTPKQRASGLLTTIGPVENLESYVKADWWREIFNANYLRTDGDVVEDRTLTQKELDIFLEILSPTKESVILDLCCGQGRHSLEMARRGFQNVFGLDRSHYLINRARSISRKEGVNAAYKEGDARKLSFSSDTFDCVFILGNSFGYFETIDDDLGVLREVMRVLKPSGKLLIDITDGSHMKSNFQPRSWEWISKTYFVCRERSLSPAGDRLISREVITHTKKGVIADQFYAERLYTREGICDLLKQSGFMGIKCHTELITDSQRHQDMGMMEKRIVVTGFVQKEWTPVRKKREAAKPIAVIMGDHRKLDIVKPNGNFDEDDFFTINELKKALAELKSYHFTYFDKHDELFNDLKTNMGKYDFVLNLCDEGFNNDATKELHVPSMLEVFNIKYTGGSPQCLAYCYDKSLVRGVAKEMDIPVPRAFLINPDDTNYIELQIGFPVIVKPNFGDSSIGINQHSVCASLEELENAILNVRQTMGYDLPIIIEEFLQGKDVSVGIIGNPPESYTPLPIVAEDYSRLPDDLPRLCGYEAKWNPESPYSQIDSIPADLSEETERFLIASCVKLFDRLECRDYARFDWRLDNNGTPRLLEVNPNPGWCWDGHLAKMAKYAGLSYAAMLDSILKASEERLQKTDRNNQLKSASS